MRTNRLENGSFERAKENGGEGQRLSAPRTGRVARLAPKRCATPGATAQRGRQSAADTSVTTVTAKIDVGFGNTLFIRGEGDGLSWEKGQPLVCIDGATWVWSSRHSQEHLKFKLLLNDELWCQGENVQVGPGAKVEVVPAF